MLRRKKYDFNGIIILFFCMFDFLDTWISAGGWWVSIPLIIVGFIALIYGADWLVEGASGVAKKYGVSDLIIGLTIVAFGTSMPEFVVNMVAASQHNSEIAITNILGSNIINIFVILGCTALIYPISSTKQSRRFDIPWSMLAAILVLFFAVYSSPAWLHVESLFSIHIDKATWADPGHFAWGEANFSFISGIGGSVLLVFFVIFLWHTFGNAKNNESNEQSSESNEKSNESNGKSSESNEKYKPVVLWKAMLLIAVGLVALVAGGEVIVKSATAIATSLGVSDAIIGLTIVALGTSLPELATSCMAAVKKNCDIALGNVIGSNIFNIFFILGTSAVIFPLPGYKGLELDAVMAALGSAMVMLFVYTTKNHEIKRWHGGVLLLIYAAYLTYRLGSI